MKNESKLTTVKLEFDVPKDKFDSFALLVGQIKQLLESSVPPPFLIHKDKGEIELSEKHFCELYTQFHGDEIDNYKQLASHDFTGQELYEFMRFCIRKSTPLDKEEMTCKQFIMDDTTSSATRCICGKEKHEH